MNYANETRMKYVDELLMIYEFHFIDDCNYDHTDLVYIDTDNCLLNQDIHHVGNMVFHNTHQYLFHKKDQKNSVSIYTKSYD